MTSSSFASQEPFESFLQQPLYPFVYHHVVVAIEIRHHVRLLAPPPSILCTHTHALSRARPKMSNKVSSKVFLVVAILAGAWDTARSRELLAKPARVPFTQDDGDGEILVRLSSDLLQLCGDVHPLIRLTDEHGLVVGQTRYDEAAYSHTDRFGYNWMIINFDLSRFQLGVTRLQVTVCSTSTVTKVSATSL